MEELIGPLKRGEKLIAMLAPSFVVDFKYPDIIFELRRIGFDKIVELSFGAKMVNINYYKILSENNHNKRKKNDFWISSVCPLVVNIVRKNYPQYAKNLMPVVSPMVAMQKICKKYYPKHKPVFIGPCIAKREEAKEFGIPYAITFRELKEIFDLYEKEGVWKKIKKDSRSLKFDKFYNDYTKIYPVSGALSDTMHVKKILKKCETKTVNSMDFIKKIDPEIKFFDVLLCKGGCIGGPGIVSQENIAERKKRILKYLTTSKKERLGKLMGVTADAGRIDFSRKF